MASFQEKKVGKCGEREKIKIIVLFRSYLARKNKLQKKIEKILKKSKKYHYGFISAQNRLEMVEKERK